MGGMQCNVELGNQLKHHLPTGLLQLHHADHSENTLSRAIFQAVSQLLVAGFTVRALSKYAHKAKRHKFHYMLLSI
jgi:hypothetical protein